MVDSSRGGRRGPPRPGPGGPVVQCRAVGATPEVRSTRSKGTELGCAHGWSDRVGRKLDCFGHVYSSPAPSTSPLPETPRRAENRRTVGEATPSQRPAAMPDRQEVDMGKSHTTDPRRATPPDALRRELADANAQFETAPPGKIVGW